MKIPKTTRVKKTINGNYVAIIDGILKYSSDNGIFKTSTYGSFDGIPVKSVIVEYCKENEIVSNYEAILAKKAKENEDYNKEYNNSEELMRLDYNGIKLQLRSNGKIYKHSLGWRRKPLSENSRTAILARYVHNQPVNSEILNQFSAEFLELLNKNQNEFISDFKAVQDKKEHQKILFNKAVKGDSLEVSLENIDLVLSVLNSQNWGAWKLPKFKDVGYSAHQYDCDGKTATTLTFDKKVTEWNVSKYVKGAPRGHLSKYSRI